MVKGCHVPRRTYQCACLLAASEELEFASALQKAPAGVRFAMAQGGVLQPPKPHAALQRMPSLPESKELRPASWMVVCVAFCRSIHSVFVSALSRQDR